jgi:hypothetical protein
MKFILLHSSSCDQKHKLSFELMELIDKKLGSLKTKTPPSR